LPPAVPRALLWLSLVAVLTHPLLDLCNTYGVRLLMPFSGRWFHGDTLFIIDPWMWLALGLAYLLARELRRRGAARPEWPARTALVLAGTYIVLMAASNLVARGIVRRAAGAEGGPAAGQLMVSPLPLNPFRRSVVIERDSVYEFGAFDWLARPHYRRAGPLVPRYIGVDAPEARAAAAETWKGRTFLDWARFPVYEVLRAGANYEVLLADARYTLSGRARFGAVAITVPRAVSSPSSRNPAQEFP
jgi:inner membrane protein